MKVACLRARTLAAIVLSACTGLAAAGDAAVESAASLRAKYAELRDPLGNNPFRKPFHVDSTESAGGVKGEIYAVLEHPFAAAGAALNSASDWCEILILPFNTKHCRVSAGDQGSTLNLRIGRKSHQAVDQAYRLDFAYQVDAQTSDYLQIRLSADQGPLGTSNYRVVLEAVPLGGRTFLHLSYSYGFGTLGRLAMQAYLRTSGKDKVGFTVAGTQPDGEPRYIGGMRGVVERNTMRYYLAIEAFLDALSAPPQARLEKRLRDWFAAVERYPRQLHEMEQGEYLDMKRREYQRQQAGPLSPIPPA